MPSLFGKAMNRALKVSGLSREEFAYKVLPGFFLDLINRYLRVKAVGLKHVPSDGPCIVIANHSGYMGFDALMIGHQIYQHKKRLPRLIAHKLWFIRKEISVRAGKLGMVPATYENGLKILKKDQLLILFPEGEEGNFKPSRYRYRLRRFRRGFVRLALSTGAPIVPAVVIGAEETHITLSQIRWAKELLGIVIPVPLNVVPLPAKWFIRFMEPIYLEKDEEKEKDVEEVSKISRQIRIKLQLGLNEELRQRRTVFL